MPIAPDFPPRARGPLDNVLNRMLERYTMHEVLHTLIELCYRRAGAEEDARRGTIYATSHWREVARYLTQVEAACTMLELHPR